jgi:hypothetical protein
MRDPAGAEADEPWLAAAVGDGQELVAAGSDRERSAAPRPPADPSVPGASGLTSRRRCRTTAVSLGHRAHENWRSTKAGQDRSYSVSTAGRCRPTLWVVRRGRPVAHVATLGGAGARGEAEFGAGPGEAGAGRQGRKGP